MIWLNIYKIFAGKLLNVASVKIFSKFSRDFYSARSLKQQSAGRHVAPLGHIILILAKQSLLLLLIREAADTNFIIVGLTRPWFESIIYHTSGKYDLPLHHRCGCYRSEKESKEVYL
jgi:hypothetical protein